MRIGLCAPAVFCAGAVAAGGSDSLVGGDGGDTYRFSAGGDLGSDTVDEAANVDTDTLDFVG